MNSLKAGYNWNIELLSSSLQIHNGIVNANEIRPNDARCWRKAQRTSLPNTVLQVSKVSGINISA